jgi:hypothetical protein
MAFQCNAFQNTGFQSCKKKSGEATYHRVVFQTIRKLDDETAIALFVAARSQKRKIKIV